MIAIAVERLFDGEALHGPCVVSVEGERIATIGAAPQGVEVEALPAGCVLAPGFVDLQANGGDGVLFNDAPTPDALRHIATTHARLGTTTILPTLISAGRELQRAGVAAVGTGPIEGIGGIHIEGPFISPRRRGIHPESAIFPPTEEDLAFLASVPKPCLITVAPEVVTPTQVTALVAAGVIVSLGHSDADFETVQRALAAGAHGFTHLYNAMSPLQHRAPGVVGAAFDSAHAFAGIIVDALHVHPAAVRLAWRSMGAGRLALVSDAMPSVGTDPPRGFVLNGQTIHLHDGKLTDDAGTLAGAHLSMAEAVRCAVTTVGLPMADALRMATATPAAWMRLEDRGRVASGLRADLVALDADFSVVAVWQGGTRIR